MTVLLLSFSERTIMTKYLIKRILHGAFAVFVVVAIVMIMIYSLMDKQLIFAKDSNYTHQTNNAKVTYRYQKWEDFGYLDYVTYADYINMLVANGELAAEDKSEVATIGRTADKDSEAVAAKVAEFRKYYKKLGYKTKRLDAVMVKANKYADGGQQVLYAYKNIPLSTRLWKYFSRLVRIDNIHYAKGEIENRGITFTLHDPVANGKLSPAIIGNGTQSKYLLYCDGDFPFIHQNVAKIRLGTSYTVNQGVDVWDTMNTKQGSYVKSTITYPTGLVESSADNLHSATYVENSLSSSLVYTDRYVDDYTSVSTVKNGKSKMGYSFIIGLLSVIMAYVLGLPLGVYMARHKDKLGDKLGTFYIVFISAVPSLAYIFLFKAVGGKLGLPTTFDLENARKLMYILPIISLGLPSVASLMKWMRRYMIDQMNSDYVKFARSGGLSETEIFVKHIVKNAMIPLVHGIPASILFSMTGAIITERVYVVPGAGNLLTEAINKYDNGVIVGVTLFYAVLSVIALILGDVLMAMVDPRISFTDKAR